MLNFMKSFFQRSEGGNMDRKTVTFTVVASIVVDGNKIWQKNIREIRRILKEQIGSIPDVKVLKIDTHEG